MCWNGFVSDDWSCGTRGIGDTFVVSDRIFDERQFREPAIIRAADLAAAQRVRLFRVAVMRD